MAMTQEWSEDDEDLGESEQGGRGRTVPLRMRQIWVEAQVQLAEAQRAMARATTKSARYMLWAALASAISSVVTVIAVLYAVLVVLPHVTH